MPNRMLTVQEFEASLKKILAETKPKGKGGKKQKIRGLHPGWAEPAKVCPLCGESKSRNRFA